MRRIAFFVEGYTELRFVERLVGEIAGHNRVRIKGQQVRGSGRKTVVHEVIAERISDQQQYYVLIVDCGGETAVRTRVQDEHASLTKQGFTEIIAIRDVRPSFTRDDIPKLRQGMRTGIKTSLAPVTIILSTMELEAWFLAEVNHYQRISPLLTPHLISGSLGFDPGSHDMTIRDHPAADLGQIYQLVGEEYSKGALAERTVGYLDYGNIYLSLRDKIFDLGVLLARLDAFLAA